MPLSTEFGDFRNSSVIELVIQQLLFIVLLPPVLLLVLLPLQSKLRMAFISLGTEAQIPTMVTQMKPPLGPGHG